MESVNNLDSKEEIIILGAGISGMIAALSFAAKNKKIIILESKSTKDERFFVDPRSTAITASSKEYFKEIGLWDDIEKISGPIRDIYVVDNKSPNMIHFDSKDIEQHTKDSKSTESHMGYMLLNVEFRKLLFKLITQNKNITILDELAYRYIDNRQDGCILELSNGEKIRSELIIVCDGRNSLARTNFFSDEIQRDYQQKAMTFIVEHEAEHEGTAVEHFTPSGPFAILPLRNPHQSSIVWSWENDKAEALLSLSNDEFKFMVQENFGKFLGKIKIQNKPKLFPLSARMVSKYVNRRIVLLADSAHVIHPLAGQGLNLGIKDISKLSRFIQEHGISEFALKKYEDARKPDNHNMLEITDTINALFTSNSKILKTGRKIGFEVVEKITPFKRALMKYAMGSRK